eukprot:scaffold9721_cov114-Alexandrium_tamarense.AAC.3
MRRALNLRSVVIGPTDKQGHEPPSDCRMIPNFVINTKSQSIRTYIANVYTKDQRRGMLRVIVN